MTATTSLRPTPLMTKLVGDWERNHAAKEHDLGELGIHTGAEILGEIRQASKASQDRVLYELVSLAHGGSKDAERILVQALLPAAARMAHRVRALDDADRTDRVGIAITASWEAVRCYKLHLRRKVMANLTMNMLGILSPDRTANDRLIHEHTTPASDDLLEAAAGPHQAPVRPEVELARLFSWAVGAGIVTTQETALLSRVSLGDEKPAQIATDLGISLASLRKRVDRIRWRLSDAVRESMAPAAA